MTSAYIITGSTGTYVYNGTLTAAQAFADQLFGKGQAQIVEVAQRSYQKVSET